MGRTYHYSIVLLFLLFSSCIREGIIQENCENNIHFVYDYNLENVDLFSHQVSKLTVFVFNENDRLQTILEDEVSGTFPDNYRMEIPLQNQKYSFIVWSGLYAQSYSFDNQISKSQLTDELIMDQLVVAVNTENNSHIITKKLHPLWHGILEKELTENETITIPLIRNTKTVRIVLKNMDKGGKDINVDDFDFIIKSNNGMYSYINNPIGTAYHYQPYYTANDPEAGAIAEISTLRLMAEQDNEFEIIHKKTGKSVLSRNVNLNTFLNALRLQQYEDLSFQEYLDRSQTFGVIILYSGYDPEKGTFSSFHMDMNNWNDREQEFNY